MPALTRFTDNGIATLVLDLPNESINKITAAVRDELQGHFDELRSSADVRAVILRSGKADSFIAGADIDEFVALQSRDEAYALVRGGQALIGQFATLGKPVVAAIHGTCLGGGLETTLACTYRIATEHSKTTLGLPEAQLGIIPAAGGCQRLPRLIGVRAALDIILAGKTISAKRAFRAGIVDELVHPTILDRVAQRAAERLAGGWKPDRTRRDVASVAIDRNPAGRRIVLKMAEAQVRKRTAGHYPAPLAALDAVEHGLRHGIGDGLKREAEHFAELAIGSVSRKLVQVFFATTQLKKDFGVAGEAPAPRDVQSLAVIGAGFMGSGIGATAALKAQVDVRFRDSELDRVRAGLTSAGKILTARLKRRRITKFEHTRLRALLSGGTDWSGFRRADLVIEAVFEDLQVKHQVFKELDARVREDCVLASNTSTIPIERIAEVTTRPERVLGMHFFSPVEKMPLLEIIVTDKTDPQALVTAMHFGRQMGKTAIVVRDRPGFWVNRILTPYMNEAGHLLRDGVSIDQIDLVMKRFGFPVGPMTLLDEVGLDVADKAAGVMLEALGERMEPNHTVRRMVRDGRLGRKNGRGFYEYRKGKRRGVDQSVYSVIDIEPRPVPDRDIEERLIFALLNEAVMALEEGVVKTPRDGDIGAIFGFGYPPFRGGPLRQVDDLGAAQAVKTLERLSQSYGRRFDPCSLLVRLAESGSSLYC